MAAPLRQHVPRSRRANARRGDPSTASSANASSARARQRQGCVAAAPPTPCAGLRPGRRFRTRSATGNCPTMPDLDPATHRARGPGSGSPATAERRSSFVSRRRVSLPAAPQERIRTVGRGGHRKPDRSGGSAKQVDGRDRPCAARRWGPPGAHHPAERATRRRPHRRRVRTGAATRRSVRPGSRGRSPIRHGADCTYPVSSAGSLRSTYLTPRSSTVAGFSKRNSSLSTTYDSRATDGPRCQCRVTAFPRSK